MHFYSIPNAFVKPQELKLLHFNTFRYKKKPFQMKKTEKGSQS